MQCPECKKQILCAVCNDTEMSQYVEDTHKFVPKPCTCQTKKDSLPEK